MRFRLGVAVASALLTVGCSTSKPSNTAPVGRHPPVALAGAEQAPDQLVGLWRVSDAAGEPAGSVLRLTGPREPEALILFRRCGALSGGWSASNTGGFLAIAYGFPEACLGSVGPGDPTPGWLADARSFVIHGSQRQLLDAKGRVIALLLPGGHPLSTTGFPPGVTLTPRLTAADRRKLDTPARPLPSGAPRATSVTLTGRWKPYPVRRYAAPQQPYLSFTADGRFSGSDGCNVLGGSWTVGPGGGLLGMTGASAGVGCNGATLDSWVMTPGRASISGSRLTLYAGDGHILDQLTR